VPFASCRLHNKRIAQLEQNVIDADDAAVRYHGLAKRDAKFGLMLERIMG
jgi:hypothetical protein